MRLESLSAHFVGAGGEGIFDTNEAGELIPAPGRTGVGVSFQCPCDACGAKRAAEPENRSVGWHYVPFQNPLDGGPPFEQPYGRPNWLRTGETIETLELRPSIYSDPAKGGCGWHGYIGLTTPGDVTTV